MYGRQEAEAAESCLAPERSHAKISPGILLLAVVLSDCRRLVVVCGLAPGADARARPRCRRRWPPSRYPRTAPGQRLEGTAWIPGGEFSMGATEQPNMNEVGMQATTDSRPIHRVYVDAFCIDATEVTNAQFAKFAAGYRLCHGRRTQTARRRFPGAPPETSSPARVVFTPPPHPVPLERSLPVVALREGCELASSRGPAQRPGGPRDIPSFTSLMKMRWPTRSGPASGCPPKRSGSSPRGAA